MIEKCDYAPMAQCAGAYRRHDRQINNVEQGQRMDTLYSREQLTWIREQAIIYQCACPAQVSKLLSEMQWLYKYQADCMNQTDVDFLVHSNIAEATKKAYPIIEQCMTDVLTLEGWDMATLTMPESLKKLTLASIEKM
jgi:hypothetical protein